MSQLRIGVVCLHTDPFAVPGSGDVGGMNVVVRHTSAAIAATGATVTVYTRRSDQHAPSTEVIDGVTVRRLPVGPATVLPKHGHDDLIDEFSAALRAEADVDLLHSHHWFSGMAAIPVARARGIAHLQSFHSIAAAPQTPLTEGERPESPARLPGELWLAQHTDAIVAVSHAEADTTVRRLGADPARVHVIHPGVDATTFHPDPARQHTQPARLLAAARLEPLKAIDLAIETLAGLPAVEQHCDGGPPQSLLPRLQVAGGATSDRAYVRGLRRLATDLHVADRVDFLGPQDRQQLATVMRQATLVLVPSHSETYGLVSLEAAASGVPVVAAASGGLAESVIDGVTGVLLPDWRPSTWVAAVADLLADAPRRHRLGAAGRAHALTRRWSDVAAATVEIYRNQLGQADPTMG
ncbi:MAG: glycosyltransferase [Beutenbergiaceae bacterium]